jgi:hypothetical protein
MHVPNQTELIFTGSVHEATMIGTVGVKPYKTSRGPDKTPQGQLKVRWIYLGDRKAEEIIAYWRNPKMPEFEWNDLSNREKNVVISFVTAFAANIKHYIAHTK